jgi:hypothetical protein
MVTQILRELTFRTGTDTVPTRTTPATLLSSFFDVLGATGIIRLCRHVYGLSCLTVHLFIQPVGKTFQGTFQFHLLRNRPIADAGLAGATGPTLLLQVAKARQIRVDGILADVMLQVIFSKDLVTIVAWPV